MKFLAAIGFAILLSGCATAGQSIDRNTAVWASTIVGCQSAAQLVGTDTDKKVWAYERRAYLTARNGGWKSDPAKLSNAVKKSKEQLLVAGETAPANQLTACRQILVSTFPNGHPLT